MSHETKLKRGTSRSRHCSGAVAARHTSSALSAADGEEALSPEEEGAGILHWDTYMPYVPDEDWESYAPGRDRFAAGSFTGDEDTVAGDRSWEYDGARIFARLEALGLPNPGGADEGVADAGWRRRLFRTK